MFEANISKGLNLLKSLKQKGLDVSFALERNNSDLIKRYKAMLDSRVKNPKNNLTEEEAKAELEEFTKGINDGTMNGTTFVSTVTLANGDTAPELHKLLLSYSFANAKAIISSLVIFSLDFLFL